MCGQASVQRRRVTYGGDGGEHVTPRIRVGRVSMGFNVGDAVGEVTLDVVAAVIFVGVAWMYRNAHVELQRMWRGIRSASTRKRYVLVWIDADPAYAEGLFRTIEEEEGQERNEFRFLIQARDLLSYPLRQKRTRAVILIDTDVSKLADDPDVAKCIGLRLHDYVRDGGGLIGSHDVIYRRVRSEPLQDVFDYATTAFHRCDQPVPYCIQPDGEGHPLAHGLPQEFELDDGEVCWGEPESDAKVIFGTGDKVEERIKNRPVVVAREYSHGRAVWLNSGDMGERMCKSLKDPEEHLVQLMRNALHWVDRTQ